MNNLIKNLDETKMDIAFEPVKVQLQPCIDQDDVERMIEEEEEGKSLQEEIDELIAKEDEEETQEECHQEQELQEETEEDDDEEGPTRHLLQFLLSNINDINKKFDNLQNSLSKIEGKVDILAKQNDTINVDLNNFMGWVKTQRKKKEKSPTSRTPAPSPELQKPTKTAVIKQTEPNEQLSTKMLEEFIKHKKKKKKAKKPEQ